MSISPMHRDQYLPAIATEAGLQLFPNTPNPFIELTMLRFRLPAASGVLLRVFDGKGQEVKTTSSAFEAGEQHIVLHRNDLNEAGLYTYQIDTDFGSARRKLMMY